jgi:transcriptional regulator with XRE-family HTH domain
MSGQSVAHWEKGRSLPAATDLPAIASALGVSVADFYDQSKPKTDIEINTPAGDRYIVQVKAGPGMGKTERFISDLVSGALTKQLKHVSITISTSEEPDESSGLEFATDFRKGWPDLSHSTKSELADIIPSLARLAEGL